MGEKSYTNNKTGEKLTAGEVDAEICAQMRKDLPHVGVKEGQKHLNFVYCVALIPGDERAEKFSEMLDKTCGQYKEVEGNTRGTVWLQLAAAEIPSHYWVDTDGAVDYAAKVFGQLAKQQSKKSFESLLMEALKKEGIEFPVGTE